MSKRKRAKATTTEKVHAFDLVATKDFDGFRRGDRIIDDELIARLLVERPHDVTKVAKSL